MRTELDPKVYADTYNLMCVYVLYLDKVYSLAWSKAMAVQTAQATWWPERKLCCCSYGADCRGFRDFHILSQHDRCGEYCRSSGFRYGASLTAVSTACGGNSDEPCVPHDDTPGAGGYCRDRQAGPPHSRPDTG